MQLHLQIPTKIYQFAVGKDIALETISTGFNYNIILIVVVVQVRQPLQLRRWTDLFRYRNDVIGVVIVIGVTRPNVCTF